MWQREADTLSNLSHNLQTARTLSIQQTQTIAHLETRNADLDRQLALSNTQEKTAKATLRSAETRTRALREEMARLKGTVAQIRGQCANDLRRRDGEMKRLKRHLEGRRGRDGTSGHVGVVVITPGAPRSQQQSRGAPDECTNVASPDYSLKQETTDFLTRLSQGLSDENDALIGLIRNTLATLRSLQGLPTDAVNSGNDSTTQDQTEPVNVTMMAPPSYEELAADTDEVLEHLRGLLTNPSFVPLEEVEIRDDEILKLREGWERMSARWKEAVSMMDGWRKRMLDTGDIVNIDDLTKGMNLAVEIPTATESGEEYESKLGDDISINVLDAEGQTTLESPRAPSPIAEDDMDVLAPELPLTTNILKDRNVNIRPMISPRKVSFPTVPEESEMYENSGLDDSMLDFSSDKASPSPTKRKTAIAVPVSFMNNTIQVFGFLCARCFADDLDRNGFHLPRPRSPCSRS